MDMFIGVLYLVAIIVIAIGSYVDIRIREVPDYLTIFLVFFAFCVRGVYSLIDWNIYHIIEGVVGFLFFSIIALVLFYGGFWGGGDSKLLMGLGALIGLKFQLEMQFLPTFLVNLLFAGAVYGLFWSIVLLCRRFKSFSHELKGLMTNNSAKMLNRVLLTFFLLAVSIAIFLQVAHIRFLILALPITLLAFFYGYVFVKAIENSCMYRWISPKKLAEGDWVVSKIVVDNKYICGPKDLGVDMKQIKKLKTLARKKLIYKVLIKEGIPFVPTFFIAFIVTVVFGNWLAMLV